MKKVLPSIVLLISLAFSVTSCYQEPGAGTAQVQVVDSKGVRQEGVFVRLYCTQNSCDVLRKGRTNANGIYSQEFDLPVVLAVRAVRYDTTVTVIGLPPNQQEQITVDSLCGEGFIQIENDETASERITILECN